MGELLTRETLLQPAKRRIATVDLPDGRKACVRSLTEREWSNYTSQTLTESGKLRTSRLQDATRRLIVLCLCDEQGTPILRPNDTEALADVDSQTTQALYDAIKKHVNTSDADIEELVKNSDGIHAEG